MLGVTWDRGASYATLSGGSGRTGSPFSYSILTQRGSRNCASPARMAIVRLRRRTVGWTGRLSHFRSHLLRHDRGLLFHQLGPHVPTGVSNRKRPKDGSDPPKKMIVSHAIR